MLWQTLLVPGPRVLRLLQRQFQHLFLASLPMGGSGHGACVGWRTELLETLGSCCHSSNRQPQSSAARLLCGSILRVFLKLLTASPGSHLAPCSQEKALCSPPFLPSHLTPRRGPTPLRPEVDLAGTHTKTHPLPTVTVIPWKIMIHGIISHPIYLRLLSQAFPLSGELSTLREVP